MTRRVTGGAPVANPVSSGAPAARPVTGGAPAARPLIKASLGVLAGTPETSQAATVKINPTSASTLSVTGGPGVRWALSVPAGAAPFVTSITMTPLAGVSLAGGQLRVTAAVRFAPDGLVFNAPVTLTVTSPPG